MSEGSLKQQKPFITLEKTTNPHDLFIDPKIYCPATIGIHREPKSDCEHEWKARIGDEYSTWSCIKCHGKVGADVWE